LARRATGAGGCFCGAAEAAVQRQPVDEQPLRQKPWVSQKPVTLWSHWTGYFQGAYGTECEHDNRRRGQRVNQVPRTVFLPGLMRSMSKRCERGGPAADEFAEKRPLHTSCSSSVALRSSCVPLRTVASAYGTSPRSALSRVFLTMRRAAAAAKSMRLAERLAHLARSVPRQTVRVVPSSAFKYAEQSARKRVLMFLVSRSETHDACHRQASAARIGALQAPGGTRTGCAKPRKERD
jgi:hypothetical protein